MTAPSKNESNPDQPNQAEPDAPDQEQSDERMPIIAMGASAGGLQALEAFFDTLPTDTGMAFVVLMHLSPDHTSNLAEILRHHTTLTVRRIEDGMPPEPDEVYVLPPKADLKIEGRRLRLTEASAHRDQRTVIDTFLRALAADQGARAIGIILSGTGTDGAQGMRALKEAGGLTMVQDPEEAEHDGMPRSAIETGFVDVVAPVRRLAAELSQYWTRAVEGPLAEDREALSEEDEQTIHKILAQVYAGTGHDFSSYKRSTVVRRIARRLTVTQRAKLADYLALLQDDPDEVQTLFRELLISVTNFFRDPAAFAALEETIIPKLFVGKDFSDQVRVWSVGCATGEEAYSLAMLLHEQAAQRDRPPEIQVFATDLSEKALETARHGLYPESVAADLTPGRVKRYLIPEGAHYRVRQELREMVLFANHNLLNDPPFSRLDLVSCRNLLIYLNREMQEQVFRLMHYALRPGGYLFLGASESIGAAGGLFSDQDKQHSIYQRRPSTREDRKPPLFPMQKRGAGAAAPDPWDEPEQEESESVDEFHRRLLVEEVASIVVDENYSIVHLTDRAARYLEYKGGAPPHNVLEMLPQTLRMELRTGLYQAFQKNRATAHEGIQLDVQGTPRHVSGRVRPVGDGKGFAQIILVETGPPQAAARPEGRDDASEDYAAQLEEELRKTKEQLQATVEEYETTTEEMESSNEELLSMNEELQSKNEEIETSKEELQSVNEELKTTNQELKTKIEELRRANSDLQNLMVATDIATLFLDRQLHIERFTPRVRELFNIRPTDTGRPLADFSQRFAYDHLIEDAQAVLDTLQTIEKELQTEKDRWFLIRLRPYRTVSDQIDGVVISFVDVTDLKTTQFEVEHEREYAVNIVDTVWEPLLVLDEDLRTQSANDAFYETFQVTPEQTTGRLVYELGNSQWDLPELRRLLEEVLPEEQVVTDYDVDHTFEDIGRRIMRLNARRIDHKQLILLAIEDITERKEAEQQLRSERNFIDRLLDTVGALVVVLDPGGRILRFNRECEVVSGYAAAEAEGQNAFELLIPPDEREGVRAVMEQHRQGKDHTTHENHWVTKDGGRRLIRWSNTVLRDDQGQVEYLIGTGIDITERRQMEREVLSAADEERRRLGQDLHDLLASQLAGIAMMIRALVSKLEADEDVAASDLQRVMNLVDAAGEQARTLSHSLMPLEVEDNELTGGVQKLVRRQEEMTGIPCTFEADDAVPRLRGEVASHLYRIAAEAINNAAKHGHPEAINVRLQVEGDRLVLRVEDDGVGIPEAPDPTNGIGLHMMQYRAELIGARLEVRALQDGGTRVQCSVPLASIRQETDPRAAP